MKTKALYNAEKSKNPKHHISIQTNIECLHQEITNKNEIELSNCSIAKSSSKGHFLPISSIIDSKQRKDFGEDDGFNYSNVKIEDVELEHDSSDELDSNDMMQPPKISVTILQDPSKLDGYIHQLKEVLLFNLSLIFSNFSLFISWKLCVEICMVLPHCH